MTQIKKITNKQGNDIYLRTHTKAVVDDNGYTAESRLQAMQDEINQAQLAVGAVPSDLTPTEGSTNWVTSGGLYNLFNDINTTLYGDEGEIVDITNQITLTQKYVVLGTDAEGYTAGDLLTFNNLNGWYATKDYIPFQGTLTINMATHDFDTTLGIGFYNSDYKCVAAYTNNNTGINGYEQRTFQVTGARYFRFCINESNREHLYAAYVSDNNGIVSKVENLEKEPVKDRNIIIAASNSSASDKSIANFVCSGTNDEKIIRDAIETLGTSGIIYLKNGTYNIDSFVETSDNSPYYAIRTPLNANFKIIGDIRGREGGGVILKISSNVIEGLDSNQQYVLFGGTGETYSNVMSQELIIKGITIVLGAVSKKIICIDGWRLGGLSIYDCVIYGPNNNRENFVAFGTEGCIGVRGMRGSNNGTNNIWRSVVCVGLGTGFAVSGEHLVLINCNAIGNRYGFTFNEYPNNFSGTRWTHPMTLINCADECSGNYPLFGDNPYLQSVDIISYMTEHYPTCFSHGGNYATETTPGQWRGTISYALQGFGNTSYASLGNSPLLPFWKNGSGKNFHSINLAQKQIAEKTEIETYAPNYNQIVFCTDLNIPLICTNPEIKEWRDFNGIIKYNINDGWT